MIKQAILLLLLAFQAPAQQPVVAPPVAAPNSRLELVPIRGPGDAVAKRVRRPRGLKPTPLWKALSIHRHQPTVAAPAQFAVVPQQLSYWLNDVDGDCVSAEEAWAKAAYSLYPGQSGIELFIPDSVVQSFASSGGYLNGANLVEVMESMASAGMQVGGVTYTDGPFQSVNWTDPEKLKAAIMVGPVKLGISANQLEAIVGDSNGWVATGFKSDKEEDHCIGLGGFGTITYLCGALGVPVPSGIDGSKPGWEAFTWDTIGIIDTASLQAITSEAYVRSPTTPQSVPSPTPVPVPPITPVPVPLPAPSTDRVITINVSAKTITTANITLRHSWGSKGDGTITEHPALGTIVVPQAYTLDGVKFSD